MDCFGTCFTHAQTSDVKLPCKRPRSPLQRWRQPLSSPLQVPLKSLQAPFKPSWSLPKVKPPLKPPSSRLQATFKPLEAPLHLRKASSPLQAPLKPLWSPFQAPLKPSEGEVPFKRLLSPFEAPFKPRSSPFEVPLKPSEGEVPFDLQTFVFPPPSWLSDPLSLLEGGFWREYLGTSLLEGDFKRLEVFSAEGELEESLKGTSSLEGLKGVWYAIDCFGIYFTHAQT